MFVTFEGIDGSGKSTQIEKLCKKLEENKVDFILTREPGGTKIGQKIRKVLLDPENKEMDAKAELLLYLADRVQHLAEVIHPALAAGKLVLCDRYHDATIAYQGFGRELDLTWMQTLEQDLILKPDLTLWFQLAPEVSSQRLAKRNEELGVELCRLEQEEQAFFARIDTGYQSISEQEPNRVKRIQADRPIVEIETEVAAFFESYLSAPLSSSPSSFSGKG